jgi:hypothetical protein
LLLTKNRKEAIVGRDDIVFHDIHFIQGRDGWVKRKKTQQSQCIFGDFIAKIFKVYSLLYDIQLPNCAE